MWDVASQRVIPFHHVFFFLFFASSILYTQRRFINANHFQRTTTRTSVYSGRPAGANHRQRQRGKRGSRHNAAAVVRRHHVVTRLSRPIGPSREECFPHKLMMSAKWTVGYRKDDNFCIIIVVVVVVVAVVAVHVVIENTKPTHRKSEYTSSQSTSSDSRQHSRVVDREKWGREEEWTLFAPLNVLEEVQRWRREQGETETASQQDWDQML